MKQEFLIKSQFAEFVLIQGCKNPTNLQTWFGGRLWRKKEEGFVDSSPIPFSWESGNNLMNRFLKNVASLIFALKQT